MEDITSSIQKKGTKNNYVPIVIISLGAIITTSVALSLLHIMFIKYCKRTRQRAQNLSIEPSTKTGLDKRVLNTIPILFYSSKTCDLYGINQDDDECVICLGQLTKGDLIRRLPNCGHIFHVSCIDHWFHAHINCPICRSVVRATACGNGAGGGGSAGHGLPRTRSGGLLCHSTKLVLPIQGLGPQDLVKVGLKRSLSMDECCVVIDTTNEQSNTTTTTTSSSSFNSSLLSNSNCCNPPLSRIDFLLSRLYQAQSTRRFNHNMHGGTLRNNGILPY